MKLYQTGEYYSQSLTRVQPYAYLLPREFDPAATGERRYPLLILLHGLTGGHKDWPTYTRIARYLSAYRLIVAFPNGGDGWYTNAVNDGERREDDLIQDFLPQLQDRFPLLPPGRAWRICGRSMGGYGAVKIALKYPMRFSSAFSHSGALERPMTAYQHPVFGEP